MNRTEKQTIVDALAQRLRAARSVYVTDFTGLNVAQVTDLRRRLHRAGVEYVVVKNTLARRAVDGPAATALTEWLRGSTALALAPEPTAAAKVLADFAKEHQKPAIRGGVVDGRRVTSEQVKQLAALPPRAQLLAELGAAMQAPMAGFVGALQALLSNFVGAVEALKQQREGAA